MKSNVKGTSNSNAGIVSTKVLITKSSKRYVTGTKHPRYYRNKLKHRVIPLIVKNPSLGVTEIAKKLKAGRHAVYSLLVDLKLTTEVSRLNFSKIYSNPRVLDVNIKISAVRNVINNQENISKIARELNVARKTIYAWIAEYKKEGSLNEDYAHGFAHPRSLGENFEKQVLFEVTKNPNLSIHALARVLNHASHGVYNVLLRNNLNFSYQRLAYANSHSSFLTHVSSPTEYSTTGVVDSVRSVFDSFSPNLSPAPPPSQLFKTLGISTAISSLFFLLMLQIGSVGMFFAVLALLMGSFFFVYSLKYYLTLGLVLSYQKDEKKVGNKNFISWILGGNTKSEEEKRLQSVGLNPDMESVILKTKPFVSVHIALFNEKNVAERVARASTSFEYPEYEVILADDSTDETSTIITDYQKKFLFKGEKLVETTGDGWVLRSVEVRPNVYLKHLHRTSRSGYKGKALDLALKLTDKRAEYVSIFDADFVPYPDSLELFLKYFQQGDNSRIAAVQGYQWHVLNKSENWITRGVRSEYSGSYVIERSGAEIYGGLKQISGSVYMIKKSALAEIGWGTSITEDFELTLKLYEAGYKVLYTPYIQAPAECVSTLRRLIRQRMRWAEGHSFNVKKMFTKLMMSPKLTRAEKMEFLYLTPYYLQAFFFLLGTFSWLISETVFKTKLPFWTETWGWSLVLTNMISLPLLNSVGLFMEESEQKDYSGIWSFVALSYIVVPFQAYAAVKGFIEKEEGPWFRTPKTGRITDLFTRGRFMRFVQDLLPVKQLNSSTVDSSYLALNTANSQFSNFNIKRSSHRKWLSKAFLSIMLAISTTLGSFAPMIESLAPKSAQAFGTANESGVKVDTIPDDFLALNTDKTVYKKDETVKISMADINYLGETVCDAEVTVSVIDPTGKVSKMSTADRSIRVNKETCEDKTILTVNPDYEARFQTETNGIHLLIMTATRFGETYKVFDTFEVNNIQDFEVTRVSATRIYPKNVYPMNIRINANKDYKGIVTDVLPINFDVFEGENSSSKLTRQKVGDKQILKWDVDWTKGHEYILSYFYDTPDKSPDLYDLGKLSIGSEFNETAFWNLAIDASGSGTNVVSPTTGETSAQDQTYTFTYDPSETFTYGGEIRIKVPNSSGWSTPQGTGGTAGYTTASITGTGKIADLLITSDATSEGNWTLTEDDSDACNTANPALDTGTFVEGSGSIKCDNSGSALTDDTDSFSFDNSGTVNWSSYDTIGFWMRSSKALTSTNGIEFAYDDTAAMNSLLQSYNTGTVSANTWTYFTFTLTATRTAVKAFGLVANGSGFDSANQWLDEVTIGPGSPTFVANGSDTDIKVRFITLDTSATVTVTYGSGGGTSGADLPSSAGSYEFTTRSRVATSTSLDSLVNISTHPTVTLSAPPSTAYSFQRKTWYDGTRYWRAYNDSTDSRIEFEYSSDGTSWTEDTSARIAVNTYDFSIQADSSNAFIAYTNGYDIETREASSYPGTGFSWGSATVTYNGSSATDYYEYPSITYDSNSKIWVSSKRYAVTTLTDTVAANGDNWGIWNFSGWQWYNTSEAGDGSGKGYTGRYGDANYWGGQRFVLSSAIPDGVTITDAKVSLYGRSTYQWDAEDYLRLYVTDSSDAPQVSAAGGRPSNDSGSTTIYPSTLSSGVRWPASGGLTWSTTGYNDSVSIASLIQQLVDTNNGLANGSHITVWETEDEIAGTNFDSEVSYWMYENGPSTAAKISISYGGYSYTAIQSSSANDISSWSSLSTITSSSDSNLYGTITARTSGNMMAVWIDGTAIKSDTYNGSTWSGSPTSVATGVTGLTTTLSAVADSSGNVHALYIDSSNNTVYREFTTSWQTAVTLDSNTGNAYPSISLNSSNSDVYAFWIRGGDIYYKKGVSTYASGNWDGAATTWQTAGTLTYISSVYSYNAPSFAVWSADTGTPPIDWDIIAVPELMWLFFGVAPLLPLLTKFRKKKFKYERS